MSEPTPAPEQPGNRGGEPPATDPDEIAAMMRAVVREQEKHREGGVDPELRVADAEPDRER